MTFNIPELTDDYDDLDMLEDDDREELLDDYNDYIEIQSDNGIITLVPMQMFDIMQDYFAGKTLVSCDNVLH